MFQCNKKYNLLIKQNVREKQYKQTINKVSEYSEEGELFDILEEGELPENERQNVFSEYIPQEEAYKLEMNTENE